MKIWVDIDNAPHVPVLKPLIRRFTDAGHRVEITARDSGETIPLLQFHDLPFRKFGRHAGRRKWRKALELMSRSAALTRYARAENFDLAVCHGARGVVLPARLQKVPLVFLTDYEHTFLAPFRLWARRTLVPNVIPDEALRRRGFDLARVAKYPGLKEEFYVYDFDPDPQILEELRVDRQKVVVVVRPPATTAHYHVSETDSLFARAFQHLAKQDSTHIILLPRTPRQREELTRASPSGSVTVPHRPVHGANLLWHADVVVGAGGTINREAACLGVPVYSLFRGEIGAVDRYLESRGRLKLLRHKSEVDDIVLRKRERGDLGDHRRRSAELVGRVAERILEVGREP